MSRDKRVVIGICKRCGYEWVARSGGKKCPLCGSKHINYSRVKVDA